VLRSERGVVSCGSPAAASAAVGILEAGGGAVDAAVAAAAVLSVVSPNACGVGGDALMLVGARRGETVAINGNGAAPSGVPSTIPRDGGGTAAVPGFVAGLLEAHERFGRLPLERVLAPAVRLAAEGFAVSEELFDALQRQRARLQRSSAGWPLLEPTVRPGSIVRFPRLADLLVAIGRDGGKAFYFGSAATAMVDAVQADGGAMTTDDLAGYSAIARAPVAAQFAGATIEVSPPASQGILLLVALRSLVRLESSTMAKAERVDLQIRVIESAFAHRSEVAQADAEDRLLADSPPLELSTDRAASAKPRASNHTAAVTVADGTGQVVSALVSLFDDFGSATFIPEFGFHLNSRLLGFEEDGANVPRAGARPVHTLSPALVRTPDRIIGISTPGADGQVQTLLQVLSGVLEDDIPLQFVLHHPRWRVVSDEVCVEEGFDPDVMEDLELRGRAVRLVPAGDQLFGAVSAVVAPIDGGALEAASDPRREAWAAVVV
jgi:gamma-glutamyltranspeptidase/glutathione hydrolase